MMVSEMDRKTQEAIRRALDKAKVRGDRGVRRRPDREEMDFEQAEADVSSVDRALQESLVGAVRVGGIISSKATSKKNGDKAAQHFRSAHQELNKARDGMPLEDKVGLVVDAMKQMVLGLEWQRRQVDSLATLNTVGHLIAAKARK